MGVGIKNKFTIVLFLLDKTACFAVFFFPSANSKSEAQHSHIPNRLDISLFMLQDTDSFTLFCRNVLFLTPFKNQKVWLLVLTSLLAQAWILQVLFFPCSLPKPSPNYHRLRATKKLKRAEFCLITFSPCHYLVMLWDHNKPWLFGPFLIKDKGSYQPLSCHMITRYVKKDAICIHLNFMWQSA